MSAIAIFNNVAAVTPSRMVITDSYLHTPVCKLEGGDEPVLWQRRHRRTENVTVDWCHS